MTTDTCFKDFYLGLSQPGLKHQTFRRPGKHSTWLITQKHVWRYTHVNFLNIRPTFIDPFTNGLRQRPGTKMPQNSSYDLL